MKKLYLDDIRIPQTEGWDIVRSYDDFVNWIEMNGLPDVVSFDHDLCHKIDESLHDPNIISTDNFRIVEQFAPYDYIIINDVLDHLDKPVFWLKRLTPLLNKTNSRMFVRCHPWTSRNGTHLSHQMNKAYLHLLLSDDELGTLGIKNKFTRKITDGLESYKRFFEESSLKILTHRIYTKSLDVEFMKNAIIVQRFKNNTHLEKSLYETLEIEYIDFELKH